MVKHLHHRKTPTLSEPKRINELIDHGSAEGTPYFKITAKSTDGLAL